MSDPETHVYVIDADEPTGGDWTGGLIPEVEGRDDTGDDLD